MRLFGGVVLAAPLFVLGPGCDSGTADLEKPTEIKNVDPMTDMPGFSKMQDQMKKDGKIKK